MCILIIVIIQLFAVACGNGDQHRAQGVPSNAKDTSSSTNLPDTMYDNVNQDSMP